MKALHLLLFVGLPVSAFAATPGVWYAGDKEAPNLPYQKARHGFGVQLLLTKDKTFFKAWDSPAPPKLEVASTAVGGDSVYSVLLFFGAGTDNFGKAKVTYSGRVTAPDGKVLKEIRDAVALDGSYRGSAYELGLSATFVGFQMAKNAEKGIYTIEITVTDHVKDVGIPLVQKIELK